MPNPTMTPEQIAVARGCSQTWDQLPLDNHVNVDGELLKNLARYAQHEHVRAEAATRERDEAYEVLAKIAAQGSGEPESTRLADCMAALAAAVLANIKPNAASAPSASPLSGTALQSGPVSREADPAAPSDTGEE